MAARPRWRVGVGAAVVLVIAAAAVAVVVAALGAPGASEVLPSPGGSPAPGSADGSGSSAPVIDPLAPASTTVVIHILGAVARPGVYELRAGDRLLDAVAAAGGFTDAADRAQLNLARSVVDGEQIVVPAVGEVLASPPPTGGAAGGGGGGGLVNLNSADAAALDTLPGVGPATAANIIAWRTENGRFTSIDDLLSVPGIGDKTLENLRKLVTV